MKRPGRVSHPSQPVLLRHGQLHRKQVDLTGMPNSDPVAAAWRSEVAAIYKVDPSVAPSVGTDSRTSTPTRVRPTLLSIASEYPGFEITQQEAWDRIFHKMAPASPHAQRMITTLTGVRKRRIVWDPETLEAACTKLTGDRMQAHAAAAIDVSGRSLRRVMEGHDRARIGSLVMSCSTGYMSPGPDLLLAKQFELRSDVRRTFIGHMGCYAALNVIKVAMDSLAARPEELVACNCTELSSIHVRNAPMPGEDPTESIITQGLFGDASISMLLGTAPEGEGIQFLGTHTEQVYDAAATMSLNIGNHAFWMTLAPNVPMLLRDNIDGFLAKLLGPLGLTKKDIAHWSIHPGGPKIVRLLGEQLQLTEGQLRASWDVLANYGNCASATVLMVLEDIMRNDKPKRGDHCVLITFGPGLTIEGAVVRF
jgi:predicted naringenin-chalcone synthase